jgi:hypothetical protein
MTTNSNVEQDEFRRTNIAQYIDEQEPTDEWSFVCNRSYGDVRIDIRFERNRADAVVEILNRDVDNELRERVSGLYKNIEVVEHDGQQVLALRQRYDSERDEKVPSLILELGDERIEEFEERLGEHEHQFKTWETKADSAARQSDLQFRVKHIEFRLWKRRISDAKYWKEGYVLIPSKVEDHMTMEQEAAWEVLQEKYGTEELKRWKIKVLCADGSDRFEEGEIYSPTDLVDEVAIEERVEEKRVKTQREARKEEIREEHPELRNTTIFPDRYDEAKEEAEETGEKQLVAKETRVNDGNHPPESDVAEVRYYITPDCDVETSQTEMH